MKNEYLRCAGQNWDDREIGAFEEFGLKYLNVALPPWFYKVTSSVSTVALFKSATQDPTLLRPVGVKSSLIRLLHGEVITSNRGALREHCEPEQLCFTPGCGASLVHTVRMMCEAHPDWPCVTLDLSNAHNEISRCATVEAFEEAPGLQHLAQHMAGYLASHHRLEASGVEWGEAGEGGTQGDPEAGAGFAVPVQPAVEELHRELAAVGGVGVFGNDDGFAVGPPEVVFQAVEVCGQGAPNLQPEVTSLQDKSVSGERGEARRGPRGYAQGWHDGGLTVDGRLHVLRGGYWNSWVC